MYACINIYISFYVYIYTYIFQYCVCRNPNQGRVHMPCVQEVMKSSSLNLILNPDPGPLCALATLATKNRGYEDLRPCSRDAQAP